MADSLEMWRWSVARVKSPRNVENFHAATRCSGFWRERQRRCTRKIRNPKDTVARTRKQPRNASLHGVHGIKPASLHEARPAALAQRARELAIGEAIT